MPLDAKIAEMFKKAKTYVSDIAQEFNASGTSGHLFRIGRPVNFPTRIDPNHRISKFLRTKMNTIDIIPCDFTINFSKVADPEASDKSIDLSGLIPEISYENAPIRYKKSCESYGIKGDYIGLRLYTTDDTVSSDSISNTFGENILLSQLNKLSEMGNQFRQLSQSIGGTQFQLSKKLSEGITSGIQTGTEFVSSKLLNLDDQLTKELTNLSGQISSNAANLILQGSRVQLPKIWNDSSYDPSFSVTIKLVSPYGHPNAIKEFIVRPLIHLLLLSTPTTSDGVTYNRPQTVSIQGYGINYTPLGVIRTITLRRGGNDTSFNIYRQPLSIDATIDFEFLVGGIAHFSGDSKDSLNYDKNIFTNINKPLQKSGEILQGKATLQTVGKLVESLRPIDPENSEELLEHSDNVGSLISTSSSSDQSQTSSTLAKAKESNSSISSENADLNDNSSIDSQLTRSAGG